jgi:UDP-2-acetamido-2,6-beta-L-arabino-hexul-4-ose reductase
MKIAITGENGFLGSHLRDFIKNSNKIEFVELGRNFIESISKLQNGDILIHAASVHRDSLPENVYFKNMDINKSLISVIKNHNLALNIIFISSIQELVNNPYGRSKKDGSRLFQEYCISHNTSFISHRLPNVFGPKAKPYKTSFVATFCYNLNNGIECVINNNLVQLCYIDDVVDQIAKLSWETQNFNPIEIKVSDVFILLKKIKFSIDNNMSIILSSKFERDLYNTLLSYNNYKLN